MSESRQLVSSQYLDYRQLAADVQEVNRLQGQIGVAFDAGKIAEQVRMEFDKLSNQLRTSLPGAFQGAVGAADDFADSVARGDAQIQKAVTHIRLVKGNLEEVGATIRSLEDNRVINTKQDKNGKVTGIDADITGDIKEANDAYKLQSELLSKIGTLKVRSVSAGKQEREVIQNQIGVLEDKLKVNQDIINNIDEQYKSKDKEEALSRKAQDITSRVEQAEGKIRDRITEQEQARMRANQALQTAYRTIVSIVTVLASRAIRQAWADAKEYAAGYYDLMNEIRIVTGQTESESERLGQSYRALATDMSVTSTEIAKAAVEFWRQGLDNDEVNARLESTIKYAKIAAIEFDDAATLITAATNSFTDFGMTAERVADVFSYLGDVSASGADEVGRALQKSAASASEFGLTFEWLGAYIATISEKTRQAPEVIGTSMNTLLARLHSIKQKGYNEEDATQINDVAKALDTVGVKLLDNDGYWRSFSDILSDVGEKWGGLDDKTKAYLTTTMAGVRQQNYFLTLMDDLSKGVEGGSRAYELYEGAMNSAGTSAQKYAIYEESVAAAHDRLTAALEGLYSLFSADMFKGFYDGMAGFITMLKDGIDATNGLSVTLPLVAAGITLISIAIKNMNTAGQTLGALLSAHPIYLAIAAFITQTTVINTVAASFNSASKVYAEQARNMEKLSTTLTNVQDKAKPLIDEFVELSGKSDITANELDRMDEILRSLSGSSGSYKSAIGDLDGAMANHQQTASTLLKTYEAINTEISDVQANQSRLWLNNKDNYSGIKDAEKELQRVRDQENIFKALDDYRAGRASFDDYIDLTAKYYENYGEVFENIKEQFESLPLQMGAAQSAYNKAMADVIDNAIKYALNTRTLSGYSDERKNVVGEILTEYITSGLEGFEGNEKQYSDKINELIASFLSGVSSSDFSAQVDSKIFENMLRNLFGISKNADISDMVANVVNSGIDPASLRQAIGTYLSTFASGSDEGILSYYNIFGTPEGTAEFIKKYVQNLMATLQDEFNQIKNEAGDGLDISQVLGLANTENGRSSLSSALKFLKEGTVSVEELQYQIDLAAKAGDFSGFVSWMSQMDSATKTTTESLYEFIEAQRAAMLDDEQVDAAKGNRFIEQLEAMQQAFDEDGMPGVEAYFDSLSENMKKGIIATYGDLIDAMIKYNKTGRKTEDATEEIEDAADDASDATKDFIRQLDKSLKSSKQLSRSWKDVKDVWEDAGKNMGDFIDDYKDYVGAVDDLKKAQDALAYIQSGATDDADKLSQAYKDLASYTGMSADLLKENLDPALWMLASDAATASNSIGWLANNLFTTAGIQFNAATWQSQLAALANSADDTTANIATLVSKMLEVAGASLYLDGNTVKVHWPSGNGGGYRGGGGGSSRGGGGGSSGGSNSGAKKKSELEKMLEMMERINEFQEHRRSMFQSAQDLFESRGQYQGVIKYLEKEREAIEAQNGSLESNIAKIKAAIAQKEKEMKGLDKNSDAYAKLAEELKALQDALMDYEQQAIDNQTDLEEIARRIKEIQDMIRDMEINLRETIYQAIEDREALKERMLQGTIDVENEIMDVLKERYEKERDMILENAELKKTALEEELDAIDEQLAKRKELAEQEDKRVKLAELEAKLARISADPTRRKEALSLSKDIADLREEIAWDLADQEAEAQKKSVEQQITSLEEYMEYVEAYYEDLFEHPQKLIAEMKQIITMTDDEIMAWLRDNSEAYRNSTEAVQQDMRNTWQNMLNDMHGTIVTYWDEVEEIISQGDEAIIQFLMENSADYAAAGHLQAQAYVDEWKKMLEDLRRAYEDVAEDIQNTDLTPVVSPGNGGGTGSGGGTGGGGGTTSPTHWKFTYNGKVYAHNADKNAATKKIEDLYTADLNNRVGSSVAEYRRNAAKNSLSSGKHSAGYKEGGMAYETGMVLVHGTKKKPERILSAEQTENFEDMLETLHAIKMYRSPYASVQKMGDMKTQSGVNVEGDVVITVSVEKLEEDADYEKMAQRVKESLYKEISRGAVVGGIRMGK